MLKDRTIISATHIFVDTFNSTSVPEYPPSLSLSRGGAWVALLARGLHQAPWGLA